MRVFYFFVLCNASDFKISISSKFLSLLRCAFYRNIFKVLSCNGKNFKICTCVFLVIKLYTQKNESKWHDTNYFFMSNANPRCENCSYIVTREPSLVSCDSFHLIK